MYAYIWGMIYSNRFLYDFSTITLVLVISSYNLLPCPLIPAFWILIPLYSLYNFILSLFPWNSPPCMVPYYFPNIYCFPKWNTNNWSFRLTATNERKCITVVSLDLGYLNSDHYKHRLVHGTTLIQEASFSNRWQLTQRLKTNQTAENKSVSNVKP